MRVRLTDDALSEFFDATDRYAATNVELGARFVDAVEAAKTQLPQFPGSGQTVATAKARRLLLAGFPYQLIYRLEADEIVIYAVAHQSRRPGYWRKRLQRP